MTAPDRSRPFCAETSRADAEPLAATASRVETWILLEYRGLWAPNAIDGSTLSRELKARLVRERARLPRARILFVRRPERRNRDGLLAFFAQTTQTERTLRRLELERYDDLLGLELGEAGEPVTQPLLLVCTHGKHDRCCARYGQPLYDAVREQVDDDWVWQSTHVGGDRFAGNLVALPDGVYYGRVEPAEAWELLESVLAGRIHPPHYRGRSCHSFAEQAAERSIREHTGLLGVEEVTVRGCVEADGCTVVSLEAGGAGYEVEVRRKLGAPTHLTCSAPRLSRPRRYVAESPRARAS